MGEDHAPGGVRLIDGATGTELDRLGVDVSPPLWSARAIEQKPETLRSLHEAYLEAGAEAVTTCTFRAHVRTLRAARRDAGAARALTREAVRLAREAARATRPDALVLGSIGPLEDCYEPALAPDEAACRREHAGRIETLLDAEADVVLLETMGTEREAVSAAIEAGARAPGRWALSMIPDAQGEVGALLSGESMARALDRIDAEAPGGLAGAWAVGINCAPAPDMADHVAWLRERLGGGVRILAYANVGRRSPDGRWSQTDAVEPNRYAACAVDWRRAGADVVGGCCGTTPATIAAIRAALDESGGG